MLSSFRIRGTLRTLFSEMGVSRKRTMVLISSDLFRIKSLSFSLSRLQKRQLRKFLRKPKRYLKITVKS